MAAGGMIPWNVLSAIAGVTVVVVMISLGTTMTAAELRATFREPWTILRAIGSVLIVVPVAALLIARTMAVPWAAEIGIMLMAIAPGAPIAIRRSMRAGGHPSFAPTLQILVALLAVASMPLAIAILNPLYAGHASISPLALGRQVVIAQLLPIGIGMVCRHGSPTLANAMTRLLSKVVAALLLLVALLLLLNVWRIVVATDVRTFVAVVVVTALALSSGHLLGGPAPDTRTATAFMSAARNPGLALLVATANHAPPAVAGMVLVYAVVSAIAITPYEIWRRRVDRRVELEPA